MTDAEEIKICIKCNQPKLLADFHKRQSNKEVRRNECKSCRTKQQKVWLQTDIGKLSNRQSRHKQYKTDKYKNKEKKYRNSIKGKETTKRLQRKYFQIHKKERNKKRREKRKIDPIFKMTITIRNAVGKAIRTKGYRKTSNTSKILGCSFEKFKNHIESKWDFWMNWNNHGKYNGEFNFGWDIDHIIPLASAKTKKELIKLCHFSNIQPLCSHINRDIKIDKLNFVNNF